MSTRFKSFVIVLFLALITLPFLLVTDLFPFLRFGMFAEPIRHEVQKEYFAVYLINSKTYTKLKPTEVGIEDHFYEYLTRNYFYRGEGVSYLLKINSLLKNKPDQLELHRYTSKSANQADTIISIQGNE